MNELLREILANPKRVQTDSGSVEQHDLDQVVKAIEAERKLQAEESGSKKIKVQVARHID